MRAKLNAAGVETSIGSQTSWVNFWIFSVLRERSALSLKQAWWELRGNTHKHPIIYPLQSSENPGLTYIDSFTLPQQIFCSISFSFRARNTSTKSIIDAKWKSRSLLLRARLVSFIVFDFFRWRFFPLGELEPIDEQLNNKLVYKISLITFSSFFTSSEGDEFQMKSIAIENVIT